MADARLGSAFMLMERREAIKMADPTPQ